MCVWVGGGRLVSDFCASGCEIELVVGVTVMGWWEVSEWGLRVGGECLENFDKNDYTNHSIITVSMVCTIAMKHSTFPTEPTNHNSNTYHPLRGRRVLLSIICIHSF